MISALLVIAKVLRRCCCFNWVHGDLMDNPQCWTDHPRTWRLSIIKIIIVIISSPLFCFGFSSIESLFLSRTAYKRSNLSFSDFSKKKKLVTLPNYKAVYVHSPHWSLWCWIRSRHWSSSDKPNSLDFWIYTPLVHNCTFKMYYVIVPTDLKVVSRVSI